MKAYAASLTASPPFVPLRRAPFARYPASSHRFRGAAVAWLSCLAICGLAADAPQFRDWATMTGANVTARLERCDGTNVYLRIQNGQVMSMPLDKLSEGDKRFAVQQNYRAVSEALERLTVPEVVFDQMPLKECIAFLQKAGATNFTGRGIDFVLSPSASTSTALLKFKARDITLSELLKIITNNAGLKYQIAGNQIRITALDDPGLLLHRTYDLVKSVRDRPGCESSEGMKRFLEQGGVPFPPGSRLTVVWDKHSGSSNQPDWLRPVGQLDVVNSEHNLQVLEERVASLNILPVHAGLAIGIYEIHGLSARNLSRMPALARSDPEVQLNDAMRQAIAAFDRIPSPTRLLRVSKGYPSGYEAKESESRDGTSVTVSFLPQYRQGVDQSDFRFDVPIDVTVSAPGSDMKISRLCKSMPKDSRFLAVEQKGRNGANGDTWYVVDVSYSGLVNPDGKPIQRFKPAAQGSVTNRTPPAHISQREQIERKTKAIIIPEIDFHEANIRDIVQFLSQASSQYDTSADDRKGVQIVLNLPQDTSSRVTMHVRRVSVLEALKLATDLAGVKYRFEGSVVCIVPKGYMGPVLARTYDLMPTALSMLLRDSIDGADEQKVKAFFMNRGVPFPEGTSVKIWANKIMVRIEADNLDAFERVLVTLNKSP